ncbi:discoidin domain-containing protein [Algoriphagus antarcticus]|uniref:F5/8 type C domain-containing protein n=1 Tax=Algoriphagus antarcticus TaxID=238540 RepID=A0A3E0D6T7_9BACT|nr:discoidin domain-containing protein [Algoriphagus antarcticus]REG78254.1 F5/8 type C domain-containing protein [Algoriphagus antarcticus]
MQNINWNKVAVVFLLSIFAFAQSSIGQTKNNLALTGTASANNFLPGFDPEKAVDGITNSESSWKNEVDGSPAWLLLKLPGATEIIEVAIKTPQESSGISDFKIQTILNGSWRDVKDVSDNQNHTISLTFDKPILTDRIRLWIENGRQVEVSEFEVYGQKYFDSTATEVKKILVNQSGYNLGRPKRFSAPEMKEQIPFEVVQQNDRKSVFSGIIKNGIGDFSEFNPESQEEFVIMANNQESFPFRIGPYWLERVTYRNMVDFMVGARHYVGTTDLIRPLSFEWRDGDFFNWALQGMVALYLSNPETFDRMEKTVSYVPNSSFPSAYKGLWGTLEPYHENAPDIIKLIHWDADVKISQGLEHEMQKAELAHFLYAWPYLEKWLPQQNFDLVYEYAKENWEKTTVKPSSTSQYDLSTEHNLLALKTQLGTTKGEMPPGYSVIPNLMMYEVTKRKGEQDAEKYFDAAYRQMEWMIQNLDWKDPLVTKGQRMSEHITMRAFAYFQTQYPKRAPQGLKEKVTDWANVAISRSENYWDFRKYSDNEDWVPPSWNETGNILGFPAALFSAMSILEEQGILQKLEILAWSHFDIAFGRNPVGRHFSHKGSEEIEGVDLGWYSAHKGGYGLLEEVKFVFDGSPKSFHYPNNPEVGNLGWTEGWVQFNTAFNMSMAYLANHYTKIDLTKENNNKVIIRLKAPVNFDPTKEESITVKLYNEQGMYLSVRLVEESPYSQVMVGELDFSQNKLTYREEKISWKKGETINVSYGLGYFQKEATFLRRD